MAEELYGNKLMMLHEQCITNITCSELESYNVNAEATAQLSERTDSTSDSEPDIPVLKYNRRDNLCEPLQTVFPPDEKHTYVIGSFQSTPQECFDGAPPFSFSCQVRINVTN